MFSKIIDWKIPPVSTILYSKKMFMGGQILCLQWQAFSFRKQGGQILCLQRQAFFFEKQGGLMIVLQATPELRVTFTKLIQTMEVQVNWNGLFVAIDNTLILQGDVRSLFFHFDSRKVVTNIIDLEIPIQKITPVEGNPYVKNVINMLLYAFGKWCNIK